MAGHWFADLVGQDQREDKETQRANLAVLASNLVA
jgi:hypothetical protein